MNEQLVLRVSRDGTIFAVYNDVLELPRLGRVRSRRASSVEWDEETQMWVVTLANGQVLGSCAARSDAIRAEVLHLQEMLMSGTIQQLWEEPRV